MKFPRIWSFAFAGASLFSLHADSLAGETTPLPAVVTTGLGVRLGAWTKPEEPPRVPVRPAAVRHKVNAGPLVSLPAPDLDAARAEDAKAAGNAKAARRISLRRALPGALEPRSDKAARGWQVLPDGSALWTAEVESAGALGLRLHFSQVTLPPSAELLVFASGNPAEVSGPFGAETLGGRSQFWSGTVFAPRVTVECRVPAGVAPERVGFRLDELLHRYVGAPGGDAAAKAADSCNLDVTCEPAWQAPARAVAGLGTVQAQGELFCTACLLNDTDAAAGTDYAMTANHCVGSQDEADDAEFYWFYQTSTCNGVAPVLSTRPRTAGGADFIGGSDSDLGNDFAFLRLRQATPGGVTYAGWSSEPLADGAAVTGIHHPSGDFKRISFGQVNSSDADYWSIQWSRGITEPGSSGSPLFNAAQEFIGQLYGGGSSCETPTRADIYGRFDQTYPLIGGWLIGQPTVPPNDRFAQAQALGGLTGESSGTSVGGAHEAGEPRHAANQGGKSLWYRWTAPATTGMTFTTEGSEFDTLLAVYSGDALGNLVQVAANDDGANFPLSSLSFPAVAGTTYHIVVDGRDGAAGKVGLEWHPGIDEEQLLNDNLATAQILTGERGEVGFYNGGATKEPGEPAHADNVGGASLWFRWTAPVSGLVSFDTEGADIDTVLAVYSGDTIATLGSAVASNDDINGDAEIYTSRFTLNAVAGRTYSIAVDGYGEPGLPAEEGFILLTWQPIAVTSAPVPVNDSFALGSILAGRSGSLTGNNLRATKQAGEPDHGGTVGGRSVWYRWTAPEDGLASFDTFDSNFDSVLAVYAGTVVSALTPLGDNDDVDRTTRQSRVTVRVTGGQLYRIAVDGFRTDSSFQRAGDIHLAWDFALGGGNDHFAEAQLLQGRSGRVTGENRSATKETGEPRHADGRGGASVWFKWTAEADGEVTFDTLGTTFDTLLGIYTGDAVAALTLLASDDDIASGRSVYTSRARYAAKAGQTLFVAVDGYRGEGAGAAAAETGSIVLNWRQTVNAALALLNPAFGPAGFSVTVSGNSGELVALERSSDLVTWEPVATSTLGSDGAGVAEDAAAPQTGGAYYRIVRP